MTTLKAHAPTNHKRASVVATEAVASRYHIEVGHPHPLGATLDKDGVNFSIFADRATSVELLLFDEDDAPLPVYSVELDTNIHRTFHIWHIYLRGAKAGIHYAYRVDGYHDATICGDAYDS